MSTYPAYAEYKDSGVAWLGKIPAGWTSKRFKHLCTQWAIYGANEPATSYDNEGVRFLRTSDINDDGQLSQEGVYLSIEKAKPYMLRDGDLLLSRSGTIGRSFWYRKEIHGDCAYAGYLVRYILNKSLLDPAFCFYFTKTAPFKQWVELTAIAATIGNVNGQKFANVDLPVPPLAEQRAIARFLDAKTAQIDALIAKKQALLAKLAEKRTALISQAVTRGLDASAPMKDSGVAWLGEIPAHWTLAPVKYFARCFNGSTPSTIEPDYWIDGTVPWLSSGKVNEDIVTEPSEWISKRALKECSLRIAPQGSVILGMVGQGKTRGLSAYLGISTTINQNMAAIVPGTKINGRFLHFFLQQLYTQIRELGRGANQPALDVRLVSNISIVVPPIKEQIQIVDKLEQWQAFFEDTTRTIGTALAKLKEYRTALITNAVTGKIDVRGGA